MLERFFLCVVLLLPKLIRDFVPLFFLVFFFIHSNIEKPVSQSQVERAGKGLKSGFASSLMTDQYPNKINF